MQPAPEKYSAGFNSSFDGSDNRPRICGYYLIMLIAYQSPNGKVRHPLSEFPLANPEEHRQSEQRFQGLSAK